MTYLILLLTDMNGWFVLGRYDI